MCPDGVMFPALCSVTSFTRSCARHREAFGGHLNHLVLVFAKLDGMCDCLTIRIFDAFMALESHMHFICSNRTPGSLAVE